MRLKILKKLKTASLNSKVTGFYEKSVLYIISAWPTQNSKMCIVFIDYATKQSLMFHYDEDFKKQPLGDRSNKQAKQTTTTADDGLHVLFLLEM